MSAIVKAYKNGTPIVKICEVFKVTTHDVINEVYSYLVKDSK